MVFFMSCRPLKNFNFKTGPFFVKSVTKKRVKKQNVYNSVNGNWLIVDKMTVGIHGDPSAALLEETTL